MTQASEAMTQKPRSPGDRIALRATRRGEATGGSRRGECFGRKGLFSLTPVLGRCGPQGHAIIALDRGGCPGRAKMRLPAPSPCRVGDPRPVGSFPAQGNEVNGTDPRMFPRKNVKCHAQASIAFRRPAAIDYTPKVARPPGGLYLRAARTHRYVNFRSSPSPKEGQRRADRDRADEQHGAAYRERGRNAHREEQQEGHAEQQEHHYGICNNKEDNGHFELIRHIKQRPLAAGLAVPIDMIDEAAVHLQRDPLAGRLQLNGHSVFAGLVDQADKPPKGDLIPDAKVRCHGQRYHTRAVATASELRCQRPRRPGLRGSVWDAHAIRNYNLDLCFSIPEGCGQCTLSKAGLGPARATL